MRTPSSKAQPLVSLVLVNWFEPFEFVLRPSLRGEGLC